LQCDLKDGRKITVREFRPADFDAVLVMFQDFSEEALQFGLPPYDRPRLERWISGLGGGILLLALERSEVVGVAMVFGRASARLKGIGELVIYIHQGYQGKGLGTFLAKALVDGSRSRGFHRIGLEVVADNVAAVKVYESAGFLSEGRLKDAFFGGDGRYHDALIMGIIL
jgi:RimJ/RimL family protein N-acetyltransferase